MSDELDDMWVHRVAVRPYLGVSGIGSDVYGPAVEVPCLIVVGQRRVDMPDGRVILANATAYAAVEWGETLTVRAEVTSQRPGVHGHILQANVYDAGSLSDMLPECVEVVVQ